MPDLHSEDVRAYWRGMSPELADFFGLIERTEDWAMDGHPEIEARLVRFGRAIDRASTERLAEMKGEEFLFLLAYIKSSKSFRLISWMDERHGGLGTRLVTRLLESEPDPRLASVMVQRLRVAQNTPYFRQLLQPERLGQLQRAIEHYREGSNA